MGKLPGLLGDVVPGRESDPQPEAARDEPPTASQLGLFG
jgi:hypothetical protein